MERIKYYTIFSLILIFLVFVSVYGTYIYFSASIDDYTSQYNQISEIIYKNPISKPKIKLICNENEYKIINISDNTEVLKPSKYPNVKVTLPDCFFLRNIIKAYYTDTKSCIENITNIFTEDVSETFFNLEYLRLEIYKKIGKQHIRNIIGDDDINKIVTRIDRIEFYKENSISLLTEDGHLFNIYSNLNENELDSLSIENCIGKYPVEQQFKIIKNL